MFFHKLRLWWVGVSFLAMAGGIPLSFAASEPPIPTLTDSQKAFLSRVARRTVRDRALDRPTYNPGYVPEQLGSLQVEVVVRLRDDGYLIAQSVAGPGPIALAVRDAAHTCADSLAPTDAFDLDMANELLVEIEVIGPTEEVPVGGNWTKPRAVDPFVQPGVHGLVLDGPRLSHRFCPTELLTSDLVLAEVLERLAKASHTGASELDQVRLRRFQTVHWYEPQSSEPIVSLYCGMTIVPMESVTVEGLDQAIKHLADYMIYRQFPSGLFAYQFDPAEDKYSEKQNLVRQVGAVVAMSAHAACSKSEASLGAANLGIRYHLQGMTPFPDDSRASFLATRDGKNKLGVTALLALAMANHPDPSEYETQCAKLINGMLRLQRPSGMFQTAFPPAVEVSAQDYFPGEALLAMATYYDHHPSPEVVDAFHKAIGFYQDYFRGAPSPAMVPWQVQAFSIMARHSKRRDYADFVFELTDWLAKRQLTAENCEWPELRGGIASYIPGRAGVATASYLEGFADALSLARHVGDQDRAIRYEDLVRGAARFVMQLQVRPQEAYYMRSKRDAVWGIRTSPSLNLLRIDHCQHALIALIKARRVLFLEKG